MRSLPLSHSIFLSICLILLTGCDQTQTAETSEKDSTLFPISKTVGQAGEFEIVAGETIRIEGTDLQLTFSAVQHESRCPSDVTCITAGYAVIEIRAEAGPIENKDFQVSIPGLVPSPYDTNDVVRVGDYAFRLIKLLPYPDTSNSSDDRHRATFRLIDPSPF